MDDLDKYIDDLFHRKLSDARASVPSSGTDWSHLSKAIKKRKFLHFHSASFNVYYLSAVAGVVATVGSFIYSNSVDKRKDFETQPQEKIVEIKDTILGNDSLIIEEDSISIAEPEVSKKCNEPSKNNKTETNSDTLIVKETIEVVENKIPVKEENKIDTIYHPTPKPVTVIKKDSIVQENKTIVTTDTIIKIDTLLIKKKGLMFKRRERTF